MITGIAGHNAGKKYVQGVGYVTPETPARPDRKCQTCGAVEPERRAVNGSGIIYCGNCRPESWETAESVGEAVRHA